MIANKGAFEGQGRKWDSPSLAEGKRKICRLSFAERSQCWEEGGGGRFGPGKGSFAKGGKGNKIPIFYGRRKRRP